MTPEDHNRLLGWAHIAHAAFYSVIGVLFGAMFVMVGIMASFDPHGPRDFPGPFFAMMGIFMGFFYIAMGLPSLIAGIGLLKRKPWAKIAAIIGGSVSAMSFPFGTAVCVYTFWFLFSEPGKALYDRSDQPSRRQPAGLYGAAASPGWDYREVKTRQYEYVPPAEPPNWRDEG